MNKKTILLFCLFLTTTMTVSAEQVVLKSEVRRLENVTDLNLLTGQRLSPLALVFGGLKDKEIALTFDDGPHPVNTPLVLKTLKQYGVKATFFVLGQNAKRYPELIKQIVSEGHNLANHTWSHQVYIKDQTADDFKADIIKTQRALIDLVGPKNVEPFFRFPTGFGAGTKDAQDMLLSLGFANFYWSMSAHDSRTTDPKETLNTSLDMLKKFKKGIFLCHDVRPHTAAMLPEFLDELYAQGYKTIQFTAK
jgi:peptidoglycan-N-acetylglucosamine deacetylase